MVGCLGSLAVKRVLGKDESPGSNPGLGCLSPFLPVVTVVSSVATMTTPQGRVPGCVPGTPTPYSDYQNVSGSVDKLSKEYKSLVLDPDQEATTHAV